MDDLVSRRAATDTALEFIVEYLGGAFDEDLQKKLLDRMLALPYAEPEWHDCDPTDKSTLPEPGSWAIWSDKEGHRIIARWKEDAIDHFFPDQRMFDFNLEDAIAWTEIPKRTKNTYDIDALKELPPAKPEPQWIPVTEGLPKKRDWYLGTFKEPDTGWINPIPFICDYVGKKTKATTKEGWILKECTDREECIDYYFNLECVAWMPLPMSYSERRQDDFPVSDACNPKDHWNPERTMRKTDIFIVYLKSGNMVQIEADKYFIDGIDLAFSRDNKTVAQFRYAEVEGWVKTDIDVFIQDQLERRKRGGYA